MHANRKGCLPAVIYMLLILGILLAFVLSSQYNADDVYTEENHEEQSETGDSSALNVARYTSPGKIL